MHVVAAFVAAFVLALAAASPAAAASRYVVVPHDTLFSIARRFRVPLPLLAHVNRIYDTSHIRPGDVLREGQNFDILRPGKQPRGEHPRNIAKFEGHQAARALAAGQGLKLDDVAG